MYNFLVNFYEDDFFTTEKSVNWFWGMTFFGVFVYYVIYLEGALRVLSGVLEIKILTIPSKDDGLTGDIKLGPKCTLFGNLKSSSGQSVGHVQ